MSPLTVRRLSTKLQPEDVARELADEDDRRLLELGVEGRREEALDRLVEDELLFRSSDSLGSSKKRCRRVSERGKGRKT